MFLMLLENFIKTLQTTSTEEISLFREFGGEIIFIASIVSALTIIVTLIATKGKNLYKFFRKAENKNINIEKIPELVQIVDRIVSGEAERNRLFLEVTNKLESITKELQILKAEKVPVYDKNTQILQILVEKFEKHCANDEIKDDLILGQTKQILINEINEGLSRGFVDTESFLYVDKLYKKYHATGANGIEDLVIKFKQLPIKN